MLKQVARELREHAPYTAGGAATGIVIMVVMELARAPKVVSTGLFDALHPLHVVLSAFATTAMYRLHSQAAPGRARLSWLKAIAIGYTGAIGVATVSDAVAPFLGGTLLGVEMHFHLPFVDPDPVRLIRLPAWLVVNACALAGIALAFWRPTTRLPHMGHTLLSTWASLFGLTGFAVAERVEWLRGATLAAVFLFLFLAVWLPCCVSDIVYPLLWAEDEPDEDNALAAGGHASE